MIPLVQLHSIQGIIACLTPTANTLWDAPIRRRRFVLAAHRPKHCPYNVLEPGIFYLPRDSRARNGYLDGLYIPVQEAIL